jgi:hypothetical protein
MKAFVINRYKDQLREADVPEPALGDRDVLVQVKAASANQLDEKIRLGEFKQILPYRLPLILGNDLAGVVAAVGPLVRTFRPGDEVYARPDKDRIGTFAERIAIAEADLALKPSSANMEAAASLPGCPDRVASARGTRQRAARAEGAHSRRRGRGRFGRDPARKAPRCDRGDDCQRVQCHLGSRTRRGRHHRLTDRALRRDRAQL